MGVPPTQLSAGDFLIMSQSKKTVAKPAAHRPSTESQAVPRLCRLAPITFRRHRGTLGGVSPASRYEIIGSASSVTKSARGTVLDPISQVTKYNGTIEPRIELVQEEHRTSRGTVCRTDQGHEWIVSIPNVNLSMASLKGYLTSDKMRPFQDVDDIELWVEDTREGHDRRPVQ
jgi:hypothetical protein